MRGAAQTARSALHGSQELGAGKEALRTVQNASTARVDTVPTRPQEARHGRGWPRPTRGLVRRGPHRRAAKLSRTARRPR